MTSPDGEAELPMFPSVIFGGESERTMTDNEIREKYHKDGIADKAFNAVSKKAGGEAALIGGASRICSRLRWKRLTLWGGGMQ